MAASEKELEEQLMEAGNRLLSPPPLVDELLPLLDQIESCLTKVEQSPSESMQKALSPSRKALVADALLRHSDLDVKVAVAACISEITRITAPDAPYEDDRMKEVFQLIVSSFEKLYDDSSRSYYKRALILETVAKVRSCVVMLDLECDALIVEMFQHFLRSIRDYHPENVFTSMETIMTLVLEESEDIPLELVSSIIQCLKRENQEVLPVARKLGAKVLENCAAKLKPYLAQAVKSMGIPLDGYSEVVARICPVSASADNDDGNAITENLADESDLPKTSSEGAAEVAEETPAVAAPSVEVPSVIVGSPKSAMSNGILLKGRDDAFVGQDPLKEADNEDHAESIAAVELRETETVGAEKTGLAVKSQSKPEKANKRKGRKSISVKSPSGPSEPHMHGEKEEEKMLDHHDSENNNVGTSLREDSAADAGLPSEHETEASVPGPMPKTSETEAVDVASPSPSGTVLDENRSRKGGRGKKKENLIEEATPSADIDSKKVSEGTSVSESKLHKRIGKRSQNDDDSSPAEARDKDDGTTNDLDVRSTKSAGKKVETSSNQLEDRKQRGKGKTVSGKGKTPSNDDEKKPVSSLKSASKPIKDGSQREKTSKASSKRKRTPEKEKESDAKEYGEELVGSMIKVWWPDDQEFYEGKVESFDAVDMRHKVFYTDGDVEVLRLKDERWKFIDDDMVSHKGDAGDGESPVASYEMSKKKKAKTTDSSTKQGKLSKGGGASSSRSKATPSKSNSKRKDDAKADSKSRDGASETAIELEVEKGGKSKDLKGDALKSAGKSKDRDDHIDASKANSKLKSDTPKNSSRSRGKATKTRGKSDANGTGKGKGSSAKVKGIDDVKKPTESTKTRETTKGRSSSKGQKSVTKTGKKRSRG
ncbi:hypothetical protein Ancab_023273 [Ancistrocladus abbreviatus]